MTETKSHISTETILAIQHVPTLVGHKSSVRVVFGTIGTDCSGELIEEPIALHVPAEMLRGLAVGDRVVLGVDLRRVEP